MCENLQVVCVTLRNHRGWPGGLTSGERVAASRVCNRRVVGETEGANQFAITLQIGRLDETRSPGAATRRALHQMAGQALLELGRVDESLAHLRKAVELAPLASFPYGYLGYALARAGHEQEARSLLAERLELAKSQYMPPSDIAAIYVGLGEFDAAFQRLEKGFEARDTWMVFLATLPQFEPLRTDPRYEDLLRRI